MNASRTAAAGPLFESISSGHHAPARRRADGGAHDARMLLCDFHIHTNYSDGKLTAPEVIDFYGKRGFDCICITDHLGDPRRLIGKLSKPLNLTFGPSRWTSISR